MNLNDSEFEQQLGALRPVAPPPELQQAIARDLAPPRDSALAVRVPTAAILARPVGQGSGLAGLLRGLGWALAGAAAAVAALVLFERTEKPQPTPAVAAVTEAAPVFAHAESSAEILEAQDEGLVFADDEAPMRQVRYNSIERHVWTNPRTGARMEIEIPREDIRFMPIALQ